MMYRCAYLGRFAFGGHNPSKLRLQRIPATRPICRVLVHEPRFGANRQWLPRYVL